MVVGGSTYAFTLVLLVFLLGIGLGSELAGRRASSPSETAADAALAQGISGAGAALLLLFFNVLPWYLLVVFQQPDFGASTRLLLVGLAIGAVVLIPAIGMGLSFPLLADLTARTDAARSADVGRAYALNTLGSIAGAVLTGFVLVVAIGSEATLRIGLVINGVAALVLAALAARGVAQRSTEHRALRVRVLGAGALASVALAVALASPGWSTRLIDRGPTIYGRAPMSAAERQAFLGHRGARQLAFHDGWNATVSVWESMSGRTLRVNGKVDASDQPDMNTQVMSGLAPVAARPGASSALVIGYGSGATTRVLASIPGMQRLRVVEIEPAVLAVSRYFTSVNHSVLERPGVSVVVDDARSALQLRARGGAAIPPGRPGLGRAVGAGAVGAGRHRVRRQRPPRAPGARSAPGGVALRRRTGGAAGGYRAHPRAAHRDARPGRRLCGGAGQARGPRRGGGPLGRGRPGRAGGACGRHRHQSASVPRGGAGRGAQTPRGHRAALARR